MRYAFSALLLLAGCGAAPHADTPVADDEARARLDELETRMSNIEGNVERTNDLAVSLGERALKNPSPAKASNLADDLRKLEQERRIEELERKENLRRLER